MQVIYVLLVIGLAVFSIINLVSYMGSQGKQKKAHEAVMARLEPARRLTDEERTRFSEVYKCEAAPSGNVYLMKDAISFIGIEVNHSQQKEFSIGEIRIHGRCAARLAKKAVGINLEDYVVPMEELEADVVELREQMQKENWSEERALEELEKLKDLKMNHTAEFVFLKDENHGRQPAFLVSLDDWRILQAGA